MRKSIGKTFLAVFVFMGSLQTAFAFKLYCEGWVQISETGGAEFGRTFDISRHENSRITLWKGNYDVLDHEIILSSVEPSVGENVKEAQYILESFNFKTKMKVSVQGRIGQTLSLTYVDSSSSSQAKIVYVKCLPKDLEIPTGGEIPSSTFCSGEISRKGRLVTEIKGEEILWRGRGIGYKAFNLNNQMSGNLRALIKWGAQRVVPQFNLNAKDLGGSLNFTLLGEIKENLEFRISKPSGNPFNLKFNCGPKL